MPTTEIAIRPIESFSELRAVEDLQKDVWGTPELDVVPLTHLVATIAAGGGYQIVEFYRSRRNKQKIGVYLLTHMSSNTQPGDVSHSITS